MGDDTTRSDLVLFVYEGNVCRSPAAQLLLMAHLGVDAPVRAGSAGLRALVGHPVARMTARSLQGRGLTVDDFAYRQLTGRLLQDASLVVTMTASQRGRDVVMMPPVLRRTWTLLGLAAALSSSPSLGPHERTPPVGGMAGVLRRAAAGHLRGDHDIPDPWGRGRWAHRRTVRLIEPAVAVLARALMVAPL